MEKIKDKGLELRMYGMVPYNLSPIQQGIQFGHAVVRYGQKHRTEEYDNWADNWETFIILNGGTTNSNLERPGTLNLHMENMKSQGIIIQDFYEPDLGDQLTAICFIVDERVFNKEKYPDFSFSILQTDPLSPFFYSTEEKYNFDVWKESIGGESNLFLREFLKGFRLA